MSTRCLTSLRGTYTRRMSFRIKFHQGKVKGQKAEFIKRAAPKRTGLKTTKVGGKSNDHNAYLKARGDATGRRGVSGGNITL